MRRARGTLLQHSIITFVQEEVLYSVNRSFSYCLCPFPRVCVACTLEFYSKPILLHKLIFLNNFDVCFRFRYYKTHTIIIIFLFFSLFLSYLYKFSREIHLKHILKNKNKHNWYFFWAITTFEYELIICLASFYVQYIDYKVNWHVH